jgi:hypothetical protein
MLAPTPTPHDRRTTDRSSAARAGAGLVAPRAHIAVPSERPLAPRVSAPAPADALDLTLARAVAERAAPAHLLTAPDPRQADGPVLARVKSRLAPITWVPRIPRREEGPAELAGDTTIQARLELLGAKLGRALQRLGDVDDETLPVFLAPEWYFTPGGRDVPYTAKEFAEVRRGLSQLSDRHKNVLLVPGSIRWHTKLKEPFKKKRFPNREKQQSVVVALWNTALAFYGGTLVHRYDKQHEGGDVSSDPTWRDTHYEFLPAEVEANSDLGQWRRDRGAATAPTIKTGADPPDVTLDWARARGAASNLFSVEGVQFAIDLCRDYGAGTALREYVHDNPAGAGVDAHLVIYGGGGAELGPDKTAAQTGGYTIVADSFGGNPAGRGKVAQVESRPGTVADAAFRGDRATYKQIAAGTTDGDLLIFDPLRLPGRKRVAFA